MSYSFSMRSGIIKILIKLNILYSGNLILVDLDEYVNKIMNKATIIIYYEKNKMCGFIAFYNNDLTNRNAFLTMLAIDPTYQRKGIGEMLLKCSIARLKHDGFIRYSLEVLKNNDKAVNLYKRNGFKIFKESENHFKMMLEI